MTSFPGHLGKLALKQSAILMKQEMMGWQWHALEHMQFICTSLQIDNNVITSPLKFFNSPNALLDAQLTVTKH